jgi:protein XagA
MEAGMRSVLPIALLALLWTTEVQAGAWTQDRGHWQIIVSVDATDAAEGFDGHSAPDAPIKFDKLYFKALIEYGWRDRLTLFAAPEYVIANSRWAGDTPVHARNGAFEAGARYRLIDDVGVLSVQSSFKTAGPFDLSNSRAPDAADIVELRLLYGANFDLFGRHGFADVEAGERWITHPRPDETVLDLTAGLWLRPDTLVMAQSFNTISGGDARPPYTYYRTHKLELSAVYCFSPRWSVQLGGFVSPAGQNALVERGISTALWVHF